MPDLTIQGEDQSPREEIPLLAMNGIDKRFPGVQALKKACLDLYAGEVLALLGENGAGKSTLIKVLSGAHIPDDGEILIDGREAVISVPQDAQALGIAVIYQEFNLVPTLSARENIFLGQERSRAGFFSAGSERQRAQDLFQRLGIRIDPERWVQDLTVAQQQIVEIAKALSMQARIIVMDEPSAALTSQEVDKLFGIITELKRSGISVIYVTHRLEEVFHIADRANIMRDGETVDTGHVRDMTRESLIEKMVGRKLENEFPKVEAPLGAVRLRIEGYSRREDVNDVSLEVRSGEIVGLTGLVGAGRTELARLIFGADRKDAGRIWIDGKEVTIRNPREAIRAGICLLTEDRKGQGLILGMSVRENFGLPSMKLFSRASFIQANRERKAFGKYVHNLRIKIPGQEEMARNLSGGNQQKVVLAKWLESNADIIIFDEPTRGIDVGAKYEIYLLMNELARKGKAIVMISSEIPEVLGMSDRILVMHEGRINGEIREVGSARQEDVLSLAVGSKKSTTEIPSHAE